MAPSGILGTHRERERERERKRKREKGGREEGGEIPAFLRLSIIDVFEHPKVATLPERVRRK